MRVVRVSRRRARKALRRFLLKAVMVGMALRLTCMTSPGAIMGSQRRGRPSEPGQKGLLPKRRRRELKRRLLKRLWPRERG